MSRVTPAQAYRLLRAAGLGRAAATTLTAIAGAESGYNPDAIGDVSLQDGTWGPSVGIWQVRTLKAQTGTGGVRDIAALRGNPQAQARAAAAIWRSSGPRAWSAYTNGSYRRFSGAAGAAAKSKHVRAPRPRSTSGAGAGAAAAAVATPAGFGLPSIPGLGPSLGPLAWAGALPFQLGPMLGDAAGAAAGAAGDTVGKGIAFALGSMWELVQPFALTTLFAVGGIGLILVGTSVLTRPVRDGAAESVEENIEPLAGLVGKVV